MQYNDNFCAFLDKHVFICYSENSHGNNLPELSQNVMDQA